MRHLLLAATLVLSASAWAVDAHGSKNNAMGYLGFAAGGVTAGGGYEYLYDGSQGVGAQLHLYQKSSDSKHPTDGYVIVGGFTGYHFFKGSWDFELAPGLNIINIDRQDPKQKNETDLGPSVQISLTQALNDRVALGFDYANYWVWFGDSRGRVLSDLDFKVKVSF